MIDYLKSINNELIDINLQIRMTQASDEELFKLAKFAIDELKRRG